MQFLSPTKQVTEKWLFILTSLFVVVLLIVFTRSGLKDEVKSIIPELATAKVTSGAESFEQIKQLKDDAWLPVRNPDSFGYNESKHWIKFHLPESTLNGMAAYVEVAYPLLDNIDVWFVQGERVMHKSEGDAKPFSQRELQYHNFLFRLPENNLPVDVYIGVQSSSVIKVPVKVWQRKGFGEHIASSNLVMGLFFGLLLAMGLSNLFFFFTTRNLTFLYYTGYVICLGLTLSTLHGYSYQYLWPEQVWFQERAVSFLASATLIFAVIFSSSLLEVRRYSPLSFKFFKVLAIAFVVTTIGSLIIDYAISIKVFLVLLTLTVFLIMGVALRLAFQKITIAGYYALAWSALLISAFSASLDNLGILSIAIPSQILLVYGAAIESLMLAFILAISYSRQRDQMLSAKELALQQEREVVATKQELIELQQRAQDDLEYKVQERTLELEIALRELSDANRELEQLNTIDPLTGIRNRRHFDKRLQAEGRRSRREQTPLTLAMVDIDHFKLINDKYGHSVGDACIKHVATTLQSILKRPTDDVCRYGGEEFAIILPNTELDGAHQLVEAMRTTLVSNPCQFDDMTIELTISGGVASAIIEYSDAEIELLKFADERLYKAKQAGRNQIVAS